MKYATRRGSNIFQFFDTEDKKRTISWQAEGVGWSIKERGLVLQESGQNEWHDIKYQGIIAKSPSMPREDFENADAAAKLVVIQGRRKSVDLCGRQAQAACRFRGDGQENAEVPRRQ